MLAKGKIKVGVIWANPWSDNLGVSALAWSCAALINEAAAQVGKIVDLHFFACNNLGLTTLNMPTGPVQATLHGYNTYGGWKFLPKILLGRSLDIFQLAAMDLILDMGEGDSFADIYGDERFGKLCESKEFCAMLGKKQILLPQTIGPFNNPKNLRRASKALTSFSAIFARDTISRMHADAILPSRRCEEIVDLAFALPWKPSIHRDVRNTIGLNVSGLLWNGGYEGRNELGLSLNYQEAIIELVDRLLKKTDSKIELVPHVFGKTCMPVEDDRLASDAVIKIIQNSRVSIAPVFTNCSEAKSYISGFEFFVGARMHACIAAFSSGVPVVPMAYSRKFNGLFTETLEYRCVADMKTSNVDDLVEQIVTDYFQHEEIKQAVLSSLKRIAEPRLQVFRDRLGDLLKSAGK